MANELIRGKRVLREYLNEVSNMSKTNNMRIFKILIDEYENRMNTDPEYFNKMADFLNRRKPKKEKDEFCFEIIKDIIHSIDVKGIYLQKYPYEFIMDQNIENIDNLV